MTREECKSRVLELKENFEKDFDTYLERALDNGEFEMGKADNNYGYARSVYAAVLLRLARSVDGWGTSSTRKVTVTLSKNAKILEERI